MDIQIINPITYPGWDDLVVSHPDYSFFHSSAWARVLFESYHYTPKYFTIINDGQLLALIPIMEVNSFLTGRRGVSLPFTDYCNPIITEGRFEDMLDHLVMYGRERRWKYWELRYGDLCLPHANPSSHYFGHILDISKSEKEIFSSFRKGAKSAIKKATNEGVDVRISNSVKSVEQFFLLNCITRKRHGLPSQPYGFFKKVYDHIICKNLGFIVIASFQDKPIAGAVYFHFGEKAVYKYGASDLNYQHLRATNLVMWEAIKWCRQNSYKKLCFGKTDPENQGLRQFKTGWGTTEQQINYYRYDLKKGSFVSGSSKVTGFHNKIFRNLPLPLLKKVGSVLYKHVG